MIIPGFPLDFPCIIPGLSLALLGYLGLSLSSIKAGDSKLLLFETFPCPLLFFFLPTGSIDGQFMRVHSGTQKALQQYQNSGQSCSSNIVESTEEMYKQEETSHRQLNS